MPVPRGEVAELFRVRDNSATREQTGRGEGRLRPLTSPCGTYRNYYLLPSPKAKLNPAE
jgi:hypothetical protein